MYLGRRKAVNFHKGKGGRSGCLYQWWPTEALDKLNSFQQVVFPGDTRRE
jgi:hypothetical protein